MQRSSTVMSVVDLPFLYALISSPIRPVASIPSDIRLLICWVRKEYVSSAREMGRVSPGLLDLGIRNLVIDLIDEGGQRVTSTFWRKSRSPRCYLGGSRPTTAI